jgi:hypothetical protein
LTGNSVVAQSIGSAVLFQSLCVSPHAHFAFSSSTVKLTIFPDFLLMRSPIEKDAALLERALDLYEQRHG